ncbi:LysR family transcriptional regulator [Shewanella sp. SM101]|uniref:LysR family transcriptional regulator n=1 Tax=unclassified Shewanella TaxID=196818 RepID=UPI0021D7DA49|nr:MULTISPECIES: LysR family transcriptional regulator [unclassified Shewanella]MCU7998012.1 LysR family transcriptional regulator [Shewanella sp. SM95]MCU8102969.1 LysR family transcriptional regulator [Shewanella sp. SM101]
MFAELPPLNSLRAFEAAARLQSMTLASKELHVTHGAVSKQIRVLEDYLGFALFVRLHKKVGLTDEAKRYLPHVQAALQTLSSATSDLRRQPTKPQTLAINVLPSLTINWLIPRMEQFKSRHPHLYVDLSIGDFAVDFSQGRYDIAIRSSTVIPKGANYIKLMDEDLCLVCAPSLAPKLQNIEDINHVTLLKHTTRPELWEYWAEKVGLTLTQAQTFGVEHFYMLSQAAASGMGAALIPRFFIEEQLANGSLVIPFDAPFTSPYRYYLLTPKSPSLPLKAQAFIEWLLEIFAPYRH